MAILQPARRPAGRSGRVDWPHLAFVTALGGWCAWFCIDAWRANAGVENLILIVPAAAAALIFYVFIAARCLGGAGPDGDAGRADARAPLAAGMARKVAVSMVLLGAFVVTGPWIGFDIACFLYILLSMASLGERRIWMLLLAPLLFCVAAIYCFNDLLQTPLPMFFARGEAP